MVDFDFDGNPIKPAFWRQFHNDLIPWECNTEAEQDALRIRVFIALAKLADDHGAYRMPLTMDSLGMVMSFLSSDRLWHLMTTVWDHDAPERWELIRARDDVYDRIVELVEQGTIEWTTDHGEPALHFADFHTARAQLENLYPERESDDEPGESTNREALARLNAMPYAEYLATPIWRARRERHLAFAKHRCQVCNADTQPLHVHHRTYERRGYESASDLIVLCAECHQLFHDHGRLVK